MLFASVRRSLFRDVLRRLEYLGALVDGTIEILQSSYGLNNEDTYNMMCQFVTRLKVYRE